MNLLPGFCILLKFDVKVLSTKTQLNMLALKEAFYTHYEMPAPIYYEDKTGHECIIFTPHGTDNKHIIKYDIENDDYIESTEYPEKEEIGAHAFVVRGNILTMFTYTDKEDKFFHLDLDNRVAGKAGWKMDIHKHSDTDRHRIKQVVLLPNGDIHSHNDGGIHWKLNIQEMKWEHVCNAAGKTRYGPYQWMIYNEIKKKLYFFGEGAVYEYDPYKNDKNQKWKESVIKLPFDKDHRFGILNPCRAEFVLGGKILMVMHTENEELWFLDMTEDYTDETQWKQRKFYENVIKNRWQSLFIVVTKYNFVHFINTFPKEYLSL